MKVSGVSGVIAAAAATLWAGQIVAEIDLPLDHDWYTVEVLIFENTTTRAPASEPSEAPSTASASEELLSTSARRAYPANLLAPVLANDTYPGGGFAPFRAFAEPWPEPPLPAEGEWFDEAGSDPETEPGEPGIVQDPLEQPVEDPTASETLTLERTDGTTDEQTNELTEPPLTPEQLREQAFAEALADFQTALATDAYQWRSDPTRLGLTAEAAALTRRAMGRILMHGAWLQPVPERGNPQPILIQSNEAIADRWRIEGTLAITLGRFLHVAAELWYQPDSGSTEGTRLDPSAAGWFSLTNDPTRDTAVLAGIPFDLNDVVDPELPYQVLSELRRMRSGELHYLDHPSFGVLIRVTPVEPPAELMDLFEQLEEATE